MSIIVDLLLILVAVFIAGSGTKKRKGRKYVTR